MKIINEQRYLEPHEACNMLGVSMTTLNRWRAEGKLSSLQLSPRKVYYPEAELQSFIHESYVPRANGRKFIREVDRDQDDRELM